MRINDWSSDVVSSDLQRRIEALGAGVGDLRATDADARLRRLGLRIVDALLRDIVEQPSAFVGLALGGEGIVATVRPRDDDRRPARRLGEAGIGRAGNDVK